jgi:F-type H+-transporting ATPase subunit b
MIKRFSLFLSSLMIILLPVITLAEEAAHEAAAGEEHHGIPFSVTLQAINFVLYGGLLFFFLRKPAIAYFRNRHEAYKQALVKAESARREAELKKREMQERLEALELSSAESIEQARVEAEAMKKRIVEEAKSMSTHLRNEARRTAEFEIERAKGQLREELISQSVALSKKMLEEKIGEPDQKRLQTEFVDKIGAKIQAVN